MAKNIFIKALDKKRDKKPSPITGKALNGGGPHLSHTLEYQVSSRQQRKSTRSSEVSSCPTAKHKEEEESSNLSSFPAWFKAG